MEGLLYEARHRRRGDGGATGPQHGPDGECPVFPEAASQPCREHHKDVPDSVGTVGADLSCSDGMVLVGRVGMLCSVLHGVTVRTRLFSTVVGLTSRLAGGGSWDGIRT